MRLANNDAKTMLAVKDLGRARRFYEEVLGLEKVDEEGEEVVAYRSGRSTIKLSASTSFCRTSSHGAVSRTAVTAHSRPAAAAASMKARRRRG